MARPKPEIQIERTIDNSQTIQILKAGELWTVLYQGQPFNLRRAFWTVNGSGNKYQRTTFPTEVPAKNLSEKLNHWFFTKDFTHRRIL